MRKSIFKGSLTVVVLVCVLWVCSFSAYAVNPDLTFIMPYQEPEVTDNTGYILLLLKHNTSGEHVLRLVEWTYQIIHYGNQGAENFYPITSVTIAMDDDSLIINPLEVAVELTTVFSVTYAYSTGSYGEAHNSFGTFAETETYEWNTTSYTIEGYQYFGNVNDLVDNLSTKKTFALVWSDEYVQYNRLKEIRDAFLDLLDEFSSLGGMSDSLGDIYDKLKQMYTEMLAQGNSLDSVVTALDSLKSSLSTINSNIVKVNGNVVDVENKLIEVYTELLEQGVSLDTISQYIQVLSKDVQSIDSRLLGISHVLGNVFKDTTAIKQYLYDFLQAQGESDFAGDDAIDTGTEDNLLDSESELVGSLELDMDDFEMDLHHNRYLYVWDMISNFWRANNQVFMIVSLCLCVGIVKLVLNR